MSKCSDDKRKLYITQLYNFLTPQIYAGLKSMYDASVKNFSPDEVFKQFQLLLKNTPNWKEQIIVGEVKRIKEVSKLDDYLEKLLNVVMITTILVMTGIPESKKNTIELSKDANLQSFVHKVYILSAEQIFLNPSLFTDVSKFNDIHNIIHYSIDKAIDSLIPIKLVLDLYEQYQTEVKPLLQEKLYSIKKEDVKQNKNNDDLYITEKSIIDKPIEIKQPPVDNKETTIVLPKPKEVHKNNDYNKAPEESEAYFKKSTKPLDVFSNTQFTKVMTPQQGCNKSNSSHSNHVTPNNILASATPNVNTSEVEKYAIGYNKKPIESDNNSSIQNYVYNKKNNNIKI